jgi:hypothetical protein
VDGFEKRNVLHLSGIEPRFLDRPEVHLHNVSKLISCHTEYTVFALQDCFLGKQPFTEAYGIRKYIVGAERTGFLWC